MFISAIIALLHALPVVGDEPPGPPAFPTYPHGNPFIVGVYGYPDAAFYEGSYWVYHANFPQDPNNAYIHAYSSQDLKTWQPHHVLSKSDFPWVNGPIYSAAIANRTGQYYIYFSTTATNSSGKWSIGVGAASKPAGPFRDVLGRPLFVAENQTDAPTGGVTVTAFNGQAYLYYTSSGSLKIAKLGQDMVTFDGSPGDPSSPNSDNWPALPPLSGAIKVFLGRGDTPATPIFYLLFKRKDCDTMIHYAVATSPNGPFNNTGTVLEVDPALATSVGHGTVIQVPNTDSWYLVYSRRLSLDDGWPDPSLSGLAYDQMIFNAHNHTWEINEVRMQVSDDFQNEMHARDIWREYSLATYQHCRPSGAEQKANLSRCSLGDGDGRSMMHNNFADFVYSIKVSIGNVPGSSLPESDANAGVVFRVKTPLLTGLSEWTDFEGYYAGITLDNKLILGKVDAAGQYTALKAADLQQQDFNNSTAPNSLLVKAVGQSIQVYLNNMTVPKLDATDAAYSAGQTGIRSYKCSAMFNDLSISSVSGTT